MRAADGGGRRHRQPARTFIRAGIERLADYQDVAYARKYFAKLKSVADADKRGGTLLAETARELALGMAYEDTVRVAELKIRPSRFERVRAEIQAADGQIVEIAEFLHPRVQEIADTLPAGLGRWLLNTGWARRFVQRFTKSRVVKTSSIGGFLMLYFIASLKPTRRHSLRFANEHKFLQEWLRTILTVAATNYPLAVEIATTRTLVKGYSDTHERGRARYDMLMQMLPQIAETADPAATLAALRKAALADDTGAALNVAIRTSARCRRPRSSAAPIASRLKSWAQSIRRDVFALYLAGRDPRVPWQAKALAGAVAAYALSPIDLIPDFIPVLGYLDDLIIVPLGILLAIRMIPAPLLAEHRAAAAAAIVQPSSNAGAHAIIAIWTALTAMVSWFAYREFLR